MLHRVMKNRESLRTIVDEDGVLHETIRRVIPTETRRLMAACFSRDDLRSQDRFVGIWAASRDEGADDCH